MTFYLVGKFQGLTPKGAAWNFCGVFTTKSKAAKACLDARYFYAPIKSNRSVEDEPATFAGIVWPAKGIKPGVKK